MSTWEIPLIRGPSAEEVTHAVEHMAFKVKALLCGRRDQGLALGKASAL